MANNSKVSPEQVGRELREIAGMGDRGKWPLVVGADDALKAMRENLHRMADQLERAKWGGSEEKLMNLAQAARYYSTSQDKLKQLAANGWNKSVAFGDTWRFKK